MYCSIKIYYVHWDVARCVAWPFPEFDKQINCKIKARYLGKHRKERGGSLHYVMYTDMIVRKRKWRQSARGSDAWRRMCPLPRPLTSLIPAGCAKITLHCQYCLISFYIMSIEEIKQLIENLLDDNLKKCC